MQKVDLFQKQILKRTNNSVGAYGTECYVGNQQIDFRLPQINVPLHVSLLEYDIKQMLNRKDYTSVNVMVPLTAVFIDIATGCCQQVPLILVHAAYSNLLCSLLMKKKEGKLRARILCGN